MNASIELKLAKLERRRTILSALIYTCYVALILAMLFMSYLAYELVFRRDPIQINLMTNLGINMLIVVFAYIALQDVHKNLKRLWAPSYVIVESENVLKVFGAVGIDDLSHIRTKPTKLRPHYIVVNDAFEKFQCTMAAVPATPEEIDSRKMLNMMGFKI